MGRKTVIDNCREMNTYEAILLAKMYRQEGMRIIKQAPTEAVGVQEFICYYIVGYTNLAFACELALKIIIVCHNGAVESLPRGHSLKNLYEQLRSDIQLVIRYMTTEYCNQKLINQVYTEEMFYVDLEKYSHAFEEARYWYERQENKSEKVAGIAFITSFSEALFSLVEGMEDNMN